MSKRFLKYPALPDAGPADGVTLRYCVFCGEPASVERGCVILGYDGDAPLDYHARCASERVDR